MSRQPFHDLPAAQYEALKADIAARGVVVPIVVAGDDGTLIDGHQRRRAAAELHVECPKMTVDGLSEEEKDALAIALNAFRRHLSGVERSQAVQKLRALGMSTRQIAAQVGTSKGSVHRDLQGGAPPGAPESGDSPDSPEGVDPETGEITEPESEKVTGSDGKSYPAKRTPRKKGNKPNTTKAVALALYKLAVAAEAFEAIDARKLSTYAEEVPVWSGNLSESMKAIHAFHEQLKGISQ